MVTASFREPAESSARETVTDTDTDSALAVLAFFSTTTSTTLAMLPRHARRAAVTAATPAHIRAALLARTAARRPLALPHAHAYAPTAAAFPRVQTSAFHSSSSRQSELPKSPFQTFVEVLREELRKNRELQDNVKQLQGDVDKLQDSEAMKKAKAAYERARVCNAALLIHI